MTLGECIRTIRKADRLSRQALSEKGRVAVGSVTALESDKGSISSLEKVCSALGVTVVLIKDDRMYKIEDYGRF